MDVGEKADAQAGEAFGEARHRQIGARQPETMTLVERAEGEPAGRQADAERRQAAERRATRRPQRTAAAAHRRATATPVESPSRVAITIRGYSNRPERQREPRGSRDSGAIT